MPLIHNMRNVGNLATQQTNFFFYECDDNKTSLSYAIYLLIELNLMIQFTFYI